MKQIRVAGYAKLAKYWEKDRDRAAEFHSAYFREKFSDPDRWRLVCSFVDITGAKEIWRRPQMLRLLACCADGQVDLIFARTKGYLAANTGEFCFLFRYLSEIAPEVAIQTEDEQYHIDTMANRDRQKEELQRMAERYCSINQEQYTEWKDLVSRGIVKQRESAQNDGKQQIE